MSHPLDNICWLTLSGPHAQYAVGTARAKRYAPGFSPIVGFADAEAPDFDALLPCCTPGERFYCDGWSGPAPTGWQIEVDSWMHRMVWDGPVPAADDTLQAVPLGPRHVDQAVALATLTRPGPFGPRTIELGDYFGCFDDEGRLVAMAGERMCTGAWREISGVCTHPDAQGRGLARRLMNLLLRRQMQRGETPFLHVMGFNTGAHALYLKMGFRDLCESPVRVVTRR